MPAGVGLEVEDVVLKVIVAIFGVVGFFDGFLVLFVEGVGGVFEEDEAEDGVFVVGGGDVAS